MPRCKNIECRTKFTAKFFLQKYCSKECLDESGEDVFKKSERVSKKRQEEEAVYSVVRKAFLLKNPFCEVCAKKATEVHHKKGRIGKLLVMVEFFMSICRTCHVYIHEHPKEARKKSWLI